MSILLSITALSMVHIAPVIPIADDEADSDKDKVICKRFPPPVGTRLRGRKICATAQEWKIQEEQRDTAMDNLQGRTGYEEGKDPG